MSEPLAPEEALGILNHYFSRMAAIVEKHGGVVDKYVGDGMMALFGAPVAHPDDPDRALRATLEMSDAVDDLNRQWQQRGLPRIDVGIGVNTAIVVAGNMGSEKRLNYTVIGDGVNLASRLETLTKTPDVRHAHYYQQRDPGESERELPDPAARRSGGERKTNPDGNLRTPRLRRWMEGMRSLSVASVCETAANNLLS